MLSRANFAPVPPVYNGNACASQVPCYRSLPSPHLHRMNSVGSSHVLLPESLQSKHEILQVKPMLARKPLLAQPMVRIRIVPVMPGAQRDGGEVRGLLAQPSRRPKVFVWAASTRLRRLGRIESITSIPRASRGGALNQTIFLHPPPHPPPLPH